MHSKCYQNHVHVQCIRDYSVLLHKMDMNPSPVLLMLNIINHGVTMTFHIKFCPIWTLFIIGLHCMLHDVLKCVSSDSAGPTSVAEH